MVNQRNSFNLKKRPLPRRREVQEKQRETVGRWRSVPVLVPLTDTSPCRNDRTGELTTLDSRRGPRKGRRTQVSLYCLVKSTSLLTGRVHTSLTFKGWQGERVLLLVDPFPRRIPLNKNQHRDKGPSTRRTVRRGVTRVCLVRDWRTVSLVVVPDSLVTTTGNGPGRSGRVWVVRKSQFQRGPRLYLVTPPSTPMRRDIFRSPYGRRVRKRSSVLLSFSWQGTRFPWIPNSTKRPSPLVS